MKAIVSGNKGFIGTNLCKMLWQGNMVIGIDKDGIGSNPESEKFVDKQYRLDLADDVDYGALDFIFDDVRPDVVFHLAAESHVDRSIDSPKEFFRSNVMGTFALLEAFRKYHNDTGKGIFIHVSTDEVFGSLKLTDKPFTENTKYDPRSPYSASKASSDHLVRSYFHTYNLPVMITNCSNNFGPYQHDEKFIPTAINALLKGEKVPVYGSGLNVRDWIYVEDHCRGLIRVAEAGVIGETYLFGGGNEVNNIEMVAAIVNSLKTLGYPIDNTISHVRFVEDRKGHDFRYAVNYLKAKAHLNWEPQTPFQYALLDTVSFFLDQKIQ